MKLADASFLRLLPDHISGDPQFAAAAAAANPISDSISKAIPNLLLWARLGGQDPKTFLPPLQRLTAARPGLSPLDLDTLESLAWQFHVDFREVAANRGQLAEMVLNSIAWHRIKGTPASMRAALSLFSFGGIYIDEHDPGMHWATYQLGFDEVASLDDLALILKICNEMQPARCRLWRVYTSDFDFRPGVWSGKIPKYAWSECWWSSYSGSYFPELPGLDDRGLLVSFGLRRRFLCEQYLTGIGLGRSDIFCERMPLFRYPVWSEAWWGEIFPPALPFAVAAIIPLHGCEYIYEPEVPWYDAPWQAWPWAKSRRWDRRHPVFSIFNIGIPFAQECWSDAPNKGERHHWWHDDWPAKTWPRGVWPDRVCKSGGWSAENSFWGTREVLITASAPEWGNFRWSDRIAEPVYRRIDEFFYDYDAWLYLPILPDPQARVAITAIRPFLLCGWPCGAWPDKPWRDDLPFFGSQIFAGFCEQLFARSWLDAAWPDLPWNFDPGRYAVCAFTSGNAWQTFRLDSPDPLSAMASLFCGRISHAVWPDTSWPEHDWYYGWTTSGEQIRAELVPSKREAPLSFAAPLLAHEIRLEIPDPAPVSQAQALAARTAGREAWQPGPWPETAWPSGPQAWSAQLECGEIRHERRPAASAGLELLPVCLDALAPDCFSGSGESWLAEIGNSPRFCDWAEKPWQAQAWNRITGYGREQAAFAMQLKSKLMEA
ncbi:MAG: hypothetical protein HDQ91_07270 [Desulfovibrio sp.]|nr:hypothetical protein [Desulfovibrio sp.]